ncbi:hypothetical protein [Ralstonia solanacearum]|uniref:hypothetical protein n=1 Tax=Ralstonia solanacearum TaxID=305 RepID=UPI003D804B5A
MQQLNTTHPIPRDVLRKPIVIGAFLDGFLVDALGCDTEAEIASAKETLLSIYRNAVVMRKTDHVPAL